MKSFLFNMVGATLILLVVIVGSLVTVDAGLSSEQVVPHFADTDLAKDGMRAFQQAGCANCHSYFGQQGQVGGPRLDWIGERYNAEMIEQIVRNPRNFYPNTMMPAVHSRVSDEEITLIAQYLASFKRN